MQPDSPRDTPVSGTYSFDHADLGTSKGSADAFVGSRYAGVLDKIVVDGATDTPDFRLAISGRSVPLHTDFHAIVDGTSGDTYLQPVKARILNSSLVRTVPSKERRTRMGTCGTGRRGGSGAIEDLLKTAIRTDPRS